MNFSRHWLWLLCIPVIVLGMERLQLDTNVLDLLPENEIVEGLKVYQAHFTDARQLIITIRSSSSEKSESVARELAQSLRLNTNLVREAVWQPPWSEDPGQLGELLALARLNQSPESFSQLTNRLAPDHLERVLDGTRSTLATSLSPMEIARAAFDPYGLIDLPGMGSDMMRNAQGMFASSEGEFRVVFVEGTKDLSDYRVCVSWFEKVKGMVQKERQARPDWNDVVIRYTGGPAFMAQISVSMERDMRGSVVWTAILIGILFWLVQRRLWPVIWLLTLLCMMLLGMLALGGLVFGRLNIVSVGAAAILLGLAVDYAVVHYHEAMAHPNLTVREIRRTIAPSIFWAACTTVCAFLMLNLGGLPGLAQMGTLVAMGVCLSAVVMVWVYLPPLFPKRCGHVMISADPCPDASFKTDVRRHSAPLRLWVTGVVFFLALGAVCFKSPQLDRSIQALRPRCEANEAMMEVQTNLGISDDSLCVVISGNEMGDVSRRLTAAETVLSQAVSNHVIESYYLPTVFWPDFQCQQSNRVVAGIIGSRGELLCQKALEEGFGSNAVVLTRSMMKTFSMAARASEVVWPTNATSQWLAGHFFTKGNDGWYVLGLIRALPPHHNDDIGGINRLCEAMGEQTWISGWQILGATVFENVQNRLWRVIVPMLILILVSLGIAFRNRVEVFLSIGVLVLGGLCLLAMMSLFGWSWNLLNLLAIPLILGTGVDYGIFMQLALRRHDGDGDVVRRSVGRALLLCGATTSIGFGSLAWSGNPGLASLGKVCAAGVVANLLISVYLLPSWWCAVKKHSHQA